MEYSNFTFMESLLVEASKHAQSAEVFCRNQDFSHCGADLRLFLEAIMKHLQQIENISYNRGKNNEAIENLYRKGIINDDVKKWFHFVRQFANSSVHSSRETPTQSEALVALEYSFKIGRFLYNRERVNKFFGDFDARLVSKTDRLIQPTETRTDPMRQKDFLVKNNDMMAPSHNLPLYSVKKTSSNEKSSMINIVNSYLKTPLLHRKNTKMANVNSAKDVWWINIPFNMFSNELHIVLISLEKTKVYWLKIEANFFNEPRKYFRDKQGQADLELSANELTLFQDVKSGGLLYDFSEFYVETFDLK